MTPKPPESRPEQAVTSQATPQATPEAASSADGAGISPSRSTKLLLLTVIVVLPVLAMLWMALGRAPKPASELSDGLVTRRSTPAQAVDYALPQATNPISALTLPDGSTVAARPNLPTDRDQTEVYVFNLITGLIGPQAQVAHVPAEDFARRFARTVANLPARYLPSAFWPVLPASGRFATQESEGKTYIAGANAARYDALVRLFTGLDTGKLVAAYVGAYPLFQKAYASLGHNYAGYYFNDAVVTAIDDLLATPDIQGPIEVVLPAATAPYANASRPWVTYRYADPELEQLSVGQKALLRLGPAHAQAIKAKLRDIRQLLVAGRPAAE